MAITCQELYFQVTLSNQRLQIPPVYVEWNMRPLDCSNYLTGSAISRASPYKKSSTRQKTRMDRYAIWRTTTLSLTNNLLNMLCNV